VRAESRPNRSLCLGRGGMEVKTGQIPATGWLGARRDPIDERWGMCVAVGDGVLSLSAPGRLLFRRRPAPFQLHWIWSP
jgi:hypothetical protein